MMLPYIPRSNPQHQPLDHSAGSWQKAWKRAGPKASNANYKPATSREQEGYALPYADYSCSLDGLGGGGYRLFPHTMFAPVSTFLGDDK